MSPVVIIAILTVLLVISILVWKITRPSTINKMTKAAQTSALISRFLRI